MFKIKEFFKLSNDEQQAIIQKRREKTHIQIEEILKKKHIRYSTQIKEKWGKIYTFTHKNKKIFTNSFTSKGNLELWHYSNEYTCSRSFLKYRK